MKCSNCQTPNLDGARFCINCGNPLPIQCPNCGHSNPALAKFCSNCGHKLDQAIEDQPAPRDSGQEHTPPLSTQSILKQLIPNELMRRIEQTGNSLVGERRVVTMLFCDVKDSTAAASRLDPEEWAEVINHAFEHMIRPVYHYEGTVARLMGDGLLAFFGAPVAHEDDPQRAVLAGLEIVQEIDDHRAEFIRRWGVEVEVRVGINTGLVVVGAVGSDLRMEYTALGNAINIAARMEQTAAPGTVQVAEATHKLTEPLFDFEPIQDLEIKGGSEPVRAYRVLAPQAVPGKLRGIPGLESPLIGRERQMEALREALGTLDQGLGSIVSVTGEAGLGKSRLVAELRRATQGERAEAGGTSPGEGHSLTRLQWIEGRSLSYETSTPYAPFMRLFKERLGLLDGQDQPDSSAYSRLKDGLAGQVPQVAAEIAPFLAAMLGIEPGESDLERVKFLEPPHLRRSITSAVSAYLENLAEQNGLVFFLDDLHWIDPTSLELLLSLLPLTRRVPLVILAAFRPRRQENSWRFHETAQRDYATTYTHLHLEPLDEQQARGLVASLLTIEDLPESARRLILERAEGNPFFLEETIRSLLETGLVVNEDGRWRATGAIHSLTIPNTLVGVITARLDRLDERARQTAQTAAVIGRTFSYEVLAGLAGRQPDLEGNLVELERRELVREKSRRPVRVYQFKHSLTQQAAYESILLSRRRELHFKAAEALRHSQPDQAAEIGRHFLEARQHERALPFLVEAGEQAARAYSNTEALELYAKALELVHSLPDFQDIPVLRAAYEGYGGVLLLVNRIPQAQENYQAMLKKAEALEDIPMQVSALNKLAVVKALYLGQFQEAELYLAPAGRLGGEHEIKPGVAETALVRCQICAAAGDFDALIENMERVVQLGRLPGQEGYLALGLEHISSSLLFLTRFEEAWEKAGQGLEAARQIGDREHEAWFLTTTMPMVETSRGNFEQAGQLVQEGLEIATRIGSLGPQLYGYWLLGEIARWRGEYEQAISYGQLALEAALPLEEFTPFMMVQPLGSLGTAYLEAYGGRTDEVARLHNRALKILENPAASPGGGAVWADLGLCAIVIGDTQVARDCFQKGLERPTMFKLLERPRYLAGSALLALKEHRLEDALRFAEEARQYVEERKMAHLAPFIALVLGQVHAKRNEPAVALDHFERAARLAGPLGFRPVRWQALDGMGRAMAALGKRAEAQAAHQQALEIIGEIGGEIQDPALRDRYLKSARSQVRNNPDNLPQV
jgi:class 3 adenylate cyclase/tetratricopeptide (TPR) repeat protein